MGVGVFTMEKRQENQETKGSQLSVSCPISPCVCQSLGSYGGRMCGSEGPSEGELPIRDMER